MKDVAAGAIPALDPCKVKEFEGLFADDHATGVKPSKATRSLKKRLYGEAYADAKFGRTYREAIQEAIAGNHPDPNVYAFKRAKTERVLNALKRRANARAKRSEDTQRKRMDKRASRNEASDVRQSKRRQLNGSLSKTAKNPIRRTPQFVKQYIDILGEAERDGYLDNRTSVLSILRRNPNLRDYKLPHWEKTSTPLKVMALSYESQKAGALTMNLRLHPKVRDQALKSARGPAAFIQDRVRKELKKVFDIPPEPWFLMEADGPLSPGHFHIHGAVIMPDQPGAEALIDKALIDAAGGWDSPVNGDKQLVMKPLNDSYVWASYVLKFMNVTNHRLDIDHKLFACGMTARRMARNGWDDLRKGLPQTRR